MKLNSVSLETSLLLEGREGLFMLEDACELVGRLLGSENFDKHPDYLYVDIPKDKKTIGVDEIAVVVQKALFKPVIFSKSIVLINHMECLTEAAQNKLLLSLEESPYLFVIGVSYENRLLDTVLSRMRRIKYRPVSRELFVSYCEDIYSPEDANVLYYACEGCPGLIHSKKLDIEMLLTLSKACREENRQNILKVLHLVKEKDKLAVSGEKHLYPYVFRVMQRSFMECVTCEVQKGNFNKALQCNDIVKYLGNELMRCDSPAYSKDNFFRAVVFCAEH